jgi:hypothetical protein
MTAPWEIARELQRPPPGGALRVVAVDTKEDAGCGFPEGSNSMRDGHMRTWLAFAVFFLIIAAAALAYSYMRP